MRIVNENKIKRFILRYRNEPQKIVLYMLLKFESYYKTGKIKTNNKTFSMNS